MDREKIIKGLEWILDGDRFGFGENWYIDSEPKTEEEQAGYYIQRAIALLKEQETANLYKCPNCGTWVSAENVVRCKDCKYYEDGTGRCALCHVHGYAETWFCADGKRDET